MNHASTVKQAAAVRATRETLSLGKKVQRSVAPAEPVLPSIVTIVPSAPRLFPLGQLMRASENVRHTNIEEGCEELADDIQAHGLLQSLIGYEDSDKIEIVGGGRRLKSLRIVKSRGLIDDTWLVPVLIRSVDEAVELSLAENLQQRTMSPVDEFFAFAELMKRGDTSPAELAKRFGFSERVIKQRLRLAELAKPILDALADRQITLDAAMAYASSQDQALQAEVFEVQQKRGRNAHQPAAVRLALRMKGVATDDRLFFFVGRERYEERGGTYEDDLFDEPGRTRVLAQPFLLETIADGMVDLQAVRLLGQLRDNAAWSPAIVGFVKTPDLRLHLHGTSLKIRPPAGFALVERDNGQQLWRAIRENGLKAHVLVGVDRDGQLAALQRCAFVPIAQKNQALKPSVADTAENRERSAIAERERDIIRWSRRLAVPPFAGTALEGRVFWPDAQHDRQEQRTIGGQSGFLVSANIFVTDDEIAAQRKAATVEADRRIAARAAEGAAA
ncbi:ParB/RepB/Spo0J family partition protein [Sphingomonas sp. GC_Shp_4]|nr:ParB/RepB/Spo0J family partition protein [Sphingomonas sp. GC_Shp_4]